MDCVEFFCGGGLQAAGIKEAGIKCIAAYELDKKACKAFEKNIGPVIRADISLLDISTIPDADLYVFSPPCQSFSTAGKQLGFEDSRGSLFCRSIEIIIQKLPKYFWIENVPGLLTKNHAEELDSILKPLMEKYEIKSRVLSAWDYGVPQKRERVFIVGVLKELKKEYRFPTPIPGDFQTKTIIDIIDLSVEFGRKTQHHDSKKHPVNELDKPCSTVKTKMNDYVRIGDKTRLLSVSEMLQIQGVPSWYELDGTITSKYRIIGNGVPSRLAWYMAYSILEVNSQSPRSESINRTRDKLNGAIKDGVNFCVVVGISGGKDSSALALWLKQNYPDLKNVRYVFADTGVELNETYEYLNKLSEYINHPIERLVSKAGTLDEIIRKRGGFLPGVNSRFCTRLSKISPIRDFANELSKQFSQIYNLVGIRFDESNRVDFGPCATFRDNISTLYPLMDDGMVEKDVFALVEGSIGLPEYYKWRTRSGCYFCFYQRRIEWVNLLENHPDLFEKARQMEKVDGENNYTWIQGMTLGELAEKKEKIKEKYYKKLKLAKENGKSLGLTDVMILEKVLKEDEPDNNQGCQVCR